MSHIVRDLTLCVALALILVGAWLIHPAVACLVGGAVLFALVLMLWPREDDG